MRAWGCVWIKIQLSNSCRYDCLICSHSDTETPRRQPRMLPTDPASLAPAAGDPGSDVEDARIIQRILDGDEDAFVDLVDRYHRRAFWIAFHVLGRGEDARDVVQESFVRLHRSLHRYDFGRSFYTWFYRIVTNLAIDALRKRKSARVRLLRWHTGQRLAERREPMPPSMVRSADTRKILTFWPHANLS